MNTNSDDDAPDRRRLWRLVGAAGLLAVPLLVVWWPGCRQYPAVTSPDALSLMKLLYAACNTKDPARLTRCEQGVAKAAQDGKLSPAERDAFATIIGMAKAGAWERAEKAAFKFAEDQVGQGSAETRPNPDPQPEKKKGNVKR